MSEWIEAGADTVGNTNAYRLMLLETVLNCPPGGGYRPGADL